MAGIVRCISLVPYSRLTRAAMGRRRLSARLLASTRMPCRWPSRQCGGAVPVAARVCNAQAGIGQEARYGDDPGGARFAGSSEAGRAHRVLAHGLHALGFDLAAAVVQLALPPVAFAPPPRET